jgi:hypothetical protein
MDHTTVGTYSNAAIGQQAIVLHDIHKRSKNIAIFQRDLAPIQEELAQIMTTEIELKVSGTVMEIFSALEQYFETHLGNCPNLLKDISEQLHLFKEVSGIESFRLLLATVNDNMCRKYHTDLNTLRLLCTYAGPGTLWLPDEIVNQKAFVARGNKGRIVIDESQVQQAGTGDVIILKGALYPKANPIVHRSPTIEESGKKRLLLRIDTNDSLSL